MRVRKKLLLSGSLLLVCCAVSQAQDIDGQAISFSCTTCHGPEGRSIGAVPSLQGLTREEIESAFEAFRSGEREATIMKQVASGFSKEEIAAIAGYFAEQGKDGH